MERLISRDVFVYRGPADKCSCYRNISWSRFSKGHRFNMQIFKRAPMKQHSTGNIVTSLLLSRLHAQTPVFSHRLSLSLLCAHAFQHLGLSTHLNQNKIFSFPTQSQTTKHLKVFSRPHNKCLMMPDAAFRLSRLVWRQGEIKTLRHK